MFAGWLSLNTRSPIPAYRPLDPGTVRRSVELVLVLGTLFLLDIATTQLIIHLGGVELNPLMAGIVANPALHLGIKGAILLIVFLMSLVAEQRVKGSGVVFYCVLISLYTCVVANNICVLLPQIPW